MSLSAIEQAARAWLQLANGGLTDAQVIRARVKAPRPPLPYLTVRVSAPNGKLTEDARVDSLSGSDPTATIAGNRFATVEVQAFGAGAFAWLQAAELALQRADVQALNDAAEVAFVRLAAPQDLGKLVDTGFEDRWSVDYECRYRVSGSAETLTPLENVGVAAHVSRYPGDPSPWTPDLGFTP